MRAATNRRAEQYIRQAKKRKTRNRIVAGLSVVVAIATTYALMLPGITMEREAQCGVEAHQHTEACYTANLICIQEERAAEMLEHTSLNCTFQPHEHTSECYNEEHELGCGQSTEYFHRHDEMCVDAQGELICTLKEKIKRNHSSSCYEEISTLICEAEATEGHQHTEECYTQVAEENPSCGVEENNGHSHNEECNATALTCTVEESVGHVHTEACKETQRSLTCTEAEVEAHSHGEGCYENINELTCGKAEGVHGHSESCYITESTLTCGKAEGEGAHTHGDGCYTEESTLTCTDEAHEHDGNCYAISKKLSCSVQESVGHAHGEACYAHAQKLNCNIGESVGHVHEENCYTSRSQLVCTKAETAGHTHDEACYATSESIICGMEEGQGSHAHGAECYTTSIACGLEEGAGAHQHNESCYGVTASLSCGQEAGAGAHTHGEKCYQVEKVRVCDHDELHKHDNSCFVTDKHNKRWAICGYAELMEHQHTEACVTVDTVTVEGHTHGDECHDLVLYCTQAEHTHTDECYPDSAEEPTAERSAEPTATVKVTEAPTAEPTATAEVTEEPTAEPSVEPTTTVEVTEEPTAEPSAEPTAAVEVTEEPTAEPSAEPTAAVEVTEEPTAEPSDEPTAEVEMTEEPTAEPSAEPTAAVEVTEEPTAEPSVEPTTTVEVTESPTAEPSVEPTAKVEVTEQPTAEPTATPALMLSVGMVNNTLQLATASDLETTVSYCCGLEEHIHDETCLDENWNIVCGLEFHAHTEDCCHACGLAAHTHSTSSVQGGIMLLDEGSSGCYDAEGNLICGLEEHTHTEACSLASEAGNAQSETTNEGKFTLANVDTDVTLNSSNKTLDLKFSADYSISVDEAQKYTDSNNPLVLKLEGIDASQLVAESNEKGWQEDSNGNGMKYRFVQNTDDTYAMEIYYDAAKLNGVTSNITGTIEFNASMDGKNKDSNGDYSISVGDQTITIKPEDIYGETPSETLNYDMTVSKQGNASLSENKLTYTITVSTTKGFPQVNIEDVISAPDGLTLTGNPVIKNVKLETWGNYTTTEVTEYTQPSNQDFTLTLPGIAVGDGVTGGQYVITVEYPIGDIGINATINDVKNTVTATATDDQKETVTNKAEHTMSITNTAVSKSGYFNTSTNMVDWKIIVNQNGKDIAGAMVKDLGFLEALGLTKEQLDAMPVGTNDIVLDNTTLLTYFGNNFKISPQDNVSLVKQGNDYFLRFDAGENNTNTSTYTIEYSTAAVPDMMGSSVTNSYMYVQGDTKADGNYTVNIPASGTVTKTNRVAATTDLSAIEIDWTSTIELPEGGIPAGGVIMDELSNPTEWVNNQQVTIRWFTWKQLNNLFAQMKQAWWWMDNYTIEVKTIAGKNNNEGWVAFSESTTGELYYAWQVCINDSALVPTDENKTITLGYSSMLDAAAKNSSSVDSYNQIKAGEVTAGSTYKWSERVTKMNGGWGTADSNTSLSETNNIITWIVDVYVDDEYEEIVVTDVIPSITMEDGSTVNLELYQIKSGQNQDKTFTYTGNTPDIYRQEHNGVVIDVTNVQDGSVAVTFKQNMDWDHTWVDTGKNFQVYFYYNLPDDLLNIEQTDEEQKITIGTFKNTASVTVKKPNESTSAYGGDDQSQTIQVTIPAKPQEDNAEFGKNGEYHFFVKAEDSNTGKAKENVLEYTVDINKLAADLNAGGDTITVQDVLVHRTGNFIQWDNGQHWANLLVTASLDSSSVRLYRAQRDANGTLLTNEDGSLVKGIELDKSLWSMAYSEKLTNIYHLPSSQTEHTLSLTVPDGEAFVLEYTYEIDIDRENPLGGCNCNASIPTSIALSGDEAGFKNTVNYNGQQEGSHSTDSNDVWKASSSTVTMNVAMSIEKVDENNVSVLLDGAEFTLYAWEDNAFVATDKVYTTVNGQFRILKEKDGYAFADDTAYYIVETKAPFGYELPDTPEKIYFYFASGTEGATLSGPDGFPGGYHELSKGGEKLTIKNAKDATSVNVTKTWNGDGSKPTSVTVYLYRYALTEKQWNELKEKGTEGESGGNTGTGGATYAVTLVKESNGTQSGLKTINVKEGYSLTLYIKGKYDNSVLDLYGVDVNGKKTNWNFDNASEYIFCDAGVVAQDITIVIQDYKNTLTAEHITYTTKNVETGEESSGSGTTTPMIYTPSTLAALTGKQLDSSFSRVLTLTESAGWSGSVSDLDLVGKDANGDTVHYVYFIEEAPVTGWESSVGGGGSDAGYNYTLENKHNGSSQTATNLHVSKVWQAADGNALPEDKWQEVQIQLYRKVKGSNDEPTLYVYNGYNTFAINANTGWAMNFTDLPHQVKDSAGTVVTEYEYFVQEITTGDFITEIAYDENRTSATITNKVVEDPAEIHVKKVWVGDAGSVKVYLRRYKQAVNSTAEDGTETLDEKIADSAFNANNAQYITLTGTTTTDSFTNLEKSATVDGTKYYYFYYVEEDESDAANYTVTYANNDGVTGNTAENPITITNTKKEDISLTVQKVWQNADGSTMTDGMPNSVNFTLWQVAGENGAKTQYPDANASYTLDASNGWSWTFDNLPQSSDGGSVSYTYEVQEPAMDGYVTTCVGNGVTKGNITIINKATRLTIEKKWLEADGTTAWTEHDSTVVYLQVSKDGAALSRENLLKYVDESCVSDSGYLMITGTSSVALDKLPLGSYAVMEVGYSTDNGTTFTQLNGDAAPEWRIGYGPSGATLSNETNIGNLTVTNTARTSLTVTKEWQGLAEGETPYTVYLRVKDSNGIVIDPAEYGVKTNTHEYTMTEGVAETWLVYTGKGSITLHDLPLGSYTVEEVAYKANKDGAAIQMITDGVELPFDITLPETVKLGTTGTLNVVNAVKPETGEITVKKAWGSGTAVPSSIDVQLVQIATPVEGASSTPGNVKVTFEVVTLNTNSNPTYDHVLDSHEVEVPIGSQVVWKATYSQGGGWMPNNNGDCSAYILDGAILNFMTVGDDPRTFVIESVTVNQNCTIRLKVDSWFWGNKVPDNKLIEDMMWRHSYSVVKPGETVVQTYTLRAEENWQHTFDNLPLVSEDGEYTYTYRIEELGAGYVVEYTNNEGITQGEITVRNTEYEQNHASITVEKKWFNADGTVMSSPPEQAKVKFRLWTTDGQTHWQEKDVVYELTAANGWKLTIDGLVIAKQYYVEEVDVIDGDGTTSLLPYFTIAYSSDEQANNGTITWSPTNTDAKNTLDDYSETLYIGNTRKPTYTLPETGGGGTQWYTGGGAMLAGVALTLMYRGNKRKRRAEE